MAEEEKKENTVQEEEKPVEGESGSAAPAEKEAAKEPVEREYIDLEVEKFDDDSPVTAGQKVSYLLEATQQLQENNRQWQQYAEYWENRAKELERRLGEPPAESDSVEEPSGRTNQMLDVLRGLQSKIAELERRLAETDQQVDRRIEQHQIRAETAEALRELQSKHGPIITEFDIYREMSKNPHLRPIDAGRRFLSRRLEEMRNFGYVRARPKPAPAPAVPPAGQAPPRPPFIPPKLPETEEEWDKLARQYLHEVIEKE